MWIFLPITLLKVLSFLLDSVLLQLNGTFHLYSSTLLLRVLWSWSCWFCTNYSIKIAHWCRNSFGLNLKCPIFLLQFFYPENRLHRERLKGSSSCWKWLWKSCSFCFGKCCTYSSFFWLPKNICGSISLHGVLTQGQCEHYDCLGLSQAFSWCIPWVHAWCCQH